jgi:peroxiredoxin Q/BCP
MLETGQAAPAFTLASTSGKETSLAALRGKKVVLYFYPKDDTPGCTKEACDFRDNLARLKKQGVVVLGVSKDSLAAHDKFRAKYDLPFDLLSDPDAKTARAYGAWGKKKNYGREYEGILRSTFLIDEQGRIAAVWSPVKVPGHVDAVLAALGGAEAPAAKAKPRAKTAAASKPVKKKAARAR